MNNEAYKAAMHDIAACLHEDGRAVIKVSLGQLRDFKSAPTPEDAYGLVPECLEKPKERPRWLRFIATE